MSEPLLLPALDEDPTSEEVLDHDDLELTEEEIADGNHMGAAIDPEDDEDSGVVVPRLMTASSDEQVGQALRSISAWDQAQRAAKELRIALLDNGVRSVSIELVAGRGPTSTGGWYASSFVAPLSHHIVSRRSQGLTPGLSLVKRGRSDLTGPLCNGYGGFDEVARIISMGWANHSGLGGPLTLAGKTIPKNNGRPYLFGWEFEGGINAADWTDSFHDFMARCAAGTQDWLGVSWSAHDEHSGWAPKRKIDRLHYTTESGRERIRMVRSGGSAPSPAKPAPKPKPTPKPTYKPWYKGKPGSRIVRMYDTGEDVKALQAWAGLPKDKQDGFNGPETVGAIKVKQRKEGLTVDGVAGPDVWGVVLRKPSAGANRTQTKSTQSAVHVSPQDGKWGNDTDRGVKAVRSIAYLNKFSESRKYTQRRVGTKDDGAWGKNSRDALDRTVRRLQNAWGTDPDGDWGKKTEAAYQAARKRNYMKF